jgi:hypothetical protein
VVPEFSYFAPRGTRRAKPLIAPSACRCQGGTKGSRTRGRRYERRVQTIRVGRPFGIGSGRHGP